MRTLALIGILLILTGLIPTLFKQMPFATLAALGIAMILMLRRELLSE